MGLLSTVRQETADMWFMLHMLQYLTISGQHRKWNANYIMVFLTEFLFVLFNDQIN